MPEYKVSSGLPAYPPNLGDKEASQLSPLYRAINGLAQKISSLTGEVKYSQAEYSQLDRLTGLTSARQSTVIIKAPAAIGYGQLVNLTASGADIIGAVADRTNPILYAHAICSIPGGIAAGTYGPVTFMQGLCAGISGTIFGKQYWLSTAGLVQLTKPTATGELAQVVGIGMGSAGLYLNISTLGDVL